MRKLIWIIFLLIPFLFLSACKNQSPTSSELMEKYMQYEAEIWLYDADYKKYSDDFAQFMYQKDVDIKLVEYSSKVYTKEQFQTILQAALMKGDGPDLVLTADPYLLDSVEKIVESGALKSWNDILSGWDTAEYYPSVTDGAAINGQVYYLPIECDVNVIVSTWYNFEKYGLTESMFSDYTKTTETIINLWEQYPEVCTILFQPQFTDMIPSIIDHNTDQSSLQSEETMHLLLQWREISQYRSQWIQENGMIENEMDALMDGKVILSIDTLRDVMALAPNMTDEQKERLLCIPAYDFNGNMPGEVASYALLPKCGNADKVISDFLSWYLFKKPYRVVGIGLSTINTYEYLCSIQSQIQSSSTVEDERLPIIPFESIDRIMQSPMHLKCASKSEQDYELEITRLLYQVSPDWEELERSINIYLSE